VQKRKLKNMMPPKWHPSLYSLQSSPTRLGTLPGSRHFGANGFLQQLQLRMRLSSTAFYRGMPWFSTMAPLLPICHLIPVSTTTTPSKFVYQLSTVTLISPGKKPASSTVLLSELLNLVYFPFFYYTILVQFSPRGRRKNMT